ncbi:MAG: glucose/arabinose dehydrogenase [Planctomycetota bacterium]|jgi:glucose/arabinose dehydrogenase
MHIPPSIGRCACTLFLCAPTFAQLPDDYVDEPFLNGLNGPVGMTFDAQGRGYVWERSGRAYVVENGALVQPPLLDISDEVGSWRDFGMLGFALDPGFRTNGLFYAYYVVDRHHLLYAGTPQYDPSANEYLNATIGRITRFRADAATDFTTTLPGSRFVLLGETPDSGVPILYESHGTGSLIVGSDGTLIASSGDGAHYGLVDNGSSPGTYWAQALQDGIIRAEENVGAFRSQMIGSQSGKLLRIDPATGDGIPSNPFFDSTQPRAPRSRVWALGLRNPFRISLRPDTGSLDPLIGDPGVVYVGDVGWSTWEDLQVVRGPAENLGWPLFEGLTRQTSYNNADTFNLDAPNPLFGTGGCNQPYFSFRELLKQERPNHNPRFPNPCDPNIQIAPATPTFMHHRPVLDWRHAQDSARVPIFVGPSARTSELGSPDCPVEGQPFSGFCAVAGSWLAPVGFGDYAGSFLQLDFSGNWMRALRFNDTNQLQEVLEFGTVVSPVFAIQDPNDQSVLYGKLNTNEVRRLRYTGSGQVAPQAHLWSRDEGALGTRFDATASNDPDGGALRFTWNFGDGTTSYQPSPLHVFANLGGAPATRSVTLTVTDSAQLSNQTNKLVQLGNTPPKVEIESFADGASYSTSGATWLKLKAIVDDSEHANSELTYSWQIFKRHDGHEHPEEVLTTPLASVVLTATPCNPSFYAYRVELTVSDPLGAATTVRHWLYPDCPPTAGVELSVPAGARLVPGEPTPLVAQVSGLVERVDFHVDGEPIASLFAPPYETSWTPPGAGRFTASALVHTLAGTSVSSGGLPLDVLTPARAEAPITRAVDDGYESPDGSVELVSAELQLGGDGTTGLLFELPVPPGATIVSAWIELTADGVTDAPSQLMISAEAAIDASRMHELPHDLSARPRGTARVSWEVEPWIYPLASGARQRTPELKDLLQEVVERPGWDTGNHMLFLLEGSGERVARARLGASDPSARLRVEFDAGE